jgi:hypothetical protein
MVQNRIASYFFLFAAIACILIQPACKKENKQAPQIRQIRAIAPAPNDSVLTKAGPGQIIVIQGANLATTSQIFFNGYPASFNSALLSDENLVVTVPADMPFASLPQDKLNTIRIVTNYGELIYQFPIVPPPPVIVAMTNEYARAGEKVILAGNNLFYIDKVIFPGAVQVTSVATNASGTLLELTVPAGISQSGPLQVMNRYGSTTSLLLYNDTTTGMLCNFDNVNTLNNWANATVTSNSTDFPGNKGTYVRFKFTDIPAKDFVWYGGGRSINCEVSLPWVPVANLNQPLDNYALKFELNTKVPWTGGSLFIVKDYSWTYLARLEPWTTSANFNTNGWKTVVVPLDQFKTKANNKDGTGSPASSLTTMLGGSGAGGVNMFVINDSESVLAAIDIAIDNIRVIKIK